MTETLSQPLPLRLLIDEAVRQARRHFRAIFPAVGIPLALVGGLLPLAQRPYMAALEPAGGRANPIAAIGGFGIMMAAMLLFMLVYGLGYAVMLAGAMDAVAGREVSMKRAWRTVLQPGTFGTLVLCWLAFGLGFACCILPGVYLGLLWSFVVPVMVEEGLRGPSALRRSGELTSYNPQRDWGSDPRVKVFLVVFVAYIAAYVVSIVVQLPLMSVQWFFMWREVAAGRRPDPAALMLKLTWIQVPSQMLAMLVQTAVHLYLSIGIALLYFDIRRRKEGTDLEAAIVALAEPLAGSAPLAP
jgi:hypothetical protein